jgi:hypothetical protein
MADDADHYEAYYSEKLWRLLPVVYRAADAVDASGANVNGPLRELVNRIGVQAAVVRRNIDRLWEDQSIESCDDWVISYLGDLLATNLVASLDARGQRLDVTKTIYYRRRKGTVAILEEIAADISGWDARVVEMFRRLSRTRHNLDPAIGAPSSAPDPAEARALQHAQGLVGAFTGTAIGGWADLRNDFGVSRVDTAFDELFHTADVRHGRGHLGWYNIPRLGVFLWRLRSFGVDLSTPVQVQQGNCTNQFTFDPTGRDIQLFAVGARAYGDSWVSPTEPQLPGRIDARLLRVALEELYAAIDPTDLVTVIPRSLAVYRLRGTDPELVDVSGVTADPRDTTRGYFIDPERGRLILRPQVPAGAFLVGYHYGFSSTLGAGPYDRRVGASLTAATPAPVTRVTGGGSLVAPLAALGPTGSVVIADSLTYDTVAPVAAIAQVTIAAENRTRPVVRMPPPTPSPTQWIFTGAGSPGTTTSVLTLDGLLVSGGDIVLRGAFDTVLITCCTLDPGSYDTKAGKLMVAADLRDLLPTHLRVEGEVRNLVVDRAILGPILTAAGGVIETLTVSDSIIQAHAGELALDLTGTSVDLTRVTLMGQADVHRLHVSDSILHDVVSVDDIQNGCVRFTAWASGSTLPRQYESVQRQPVTTTFVSRVFGNPGYAQLLSAIGAQLLEGAEDGSEMGAFSREKGAIKARSIRIKYREFMPVGLGPVLINVT